MALLQCKIGPNGEVYMPTVNPCPDFDAEADAEAIENAIKNMGTDEDALNEIIGRRTSNEKVAIVKAYKSTFGQDLIERIEGELSGNYQKLVVACLHSPYKHLAYCCYNAISGAGTDEQVLIQILASSTNEEIVLIKEAYQEVLIEFGNDPNQRNLEKDIDNDCSGYFGRVLTALVQADRNQPSDEDMAAAEFQGIASLIDEEKAQDQARELYDGGEGKMGTDESTFIKILVKSSVWQIAAIALAYQQLSSKSLVEAIDSEMDSSIGNIIQLVVGCALDRPGSYAHMLKKATKGFGTDDDSLIRLVSSRADIDMGSIKEAYLGKYETPLADDIKGDTGGNYEKLLLILIGEE